MQRQATRFAQQNATRLRSTMTDAEQRLWYRLRRGQLGVRFRRQHPFGFYIADFACLDPRLIVEVDGSQHVARSGHDQRREAFFARHCFLTLRFHANEALTETDGVVERIDEALTRLRVNAPSPTLPRRGRAQN